MNGPPFIHVQGDDGIVVGSPEIHSPGRSRNDTSCHFNDYKYQKYKHNLQIKWRACRSEKLESLICPAIHLYNRPFLISSLTPSLYLVMGHLHRHIFWTFRRDQVEIYINLDVA